MWYGWKEIPELLLGISGHMLRASGASRIGSGGMGVEFDAKENKSSGEGET